MGIIKDTVVGAGTFAGGTVTHTVKDGLTGAKWGFMIPAVLGAVATGAAAFTGGWAAVPIALGAYAVAMLPATLSSWFTGGGGLFGKAATVVLGGVGATLAVAGGLHALAAGLAVAGLFGAVTAFTTVGGAKIGGIFGFLTGGFRALSKSGERRTQNLEQELVTSKHRHMQAEQNYNHTMANIDQLKQMQHSQYANTERQLPYNQAMAETRNAYASFDNPDAKGNGYHVGKYASGNGELQLEGGKVR